METHLNKKSIKSAALAFLLSVIVFLLALILQFILLYRNDIFNKNINTTSITKLMILESLSLLYLVIPISLLLSAALFFRQYLNVPHNTVNFKKLFIASLILSIFCFIGVSFIKPVVDLHKLSKLYAFRVKAANEPLEEMSLSLFKNNYECLNYFELEA